MSVCWDHPLYLRPQYWKALIGVYVCQSLDYQIKSLINIISLTRQ